MEAQTSLLTAMFKVKRLSKADLQQDARHVSRGCGSVELKTGSVCASPHHLLLPFQGCFSSTLGTLERVGILIFLAPFLETLPALLSPQQWRSVGVGLPGGSS